MKKLVLTMLVIGSASCSSCVTTKATQEPQPAPGVEQPTAVSEPEKKGCELKDPPDCDKQIESEPVVSE